MLHSEDSYKTSITVLMKVKTLPALIHTWGGLLWPQGGANAPPELRGSSASLQQQLFQEAGCRWGMMAGRAGTQITAAHQHTAQSSNTCCTRNRFRHQSRRWPISLQLLQPDNLLLFFIIPDSKSLSFRLLVGQKKELKDFGLRKNVFTVFDTLQTKPIIMEIISSCSLYTHSHKNMIMAKHCLYHPYFKQQIKIKSNSF